MKWVKRERARREELWKLRSPHVDGDCRSGQLEGIWEPDASCLPQFDGQTINSTAWQSARDGSGVCELERGAMPALNPPAPARRASSVQQRSTRQTRTVAVVCSKSRLSAAHQLNVRCSSRQSRPRGPARVEAATLERAASSAAEKAGKVVEAAADVVTGTDRADAVLLQGESAHSTLSAGLT